MQISLLTFGTLALAGLVKRDQVVVVETVTVTADKRQQATPAPSADFVDGTIPCSQFPSADGIVSLDYLGNNGWSGIQCGSDFSNSNTCSEGCYCSYACQPGMAKTQWPANQPSSGQSVGGLYCQNGFLYRTETSTSQLCQEQAQSAYLYNELSNDVTVCQTDYPGTEDMVIPTVANPGNSSQILTTIIAADYYQWQGQPTSSQFYVQMAGVTPQEGCQWGSAGSNIGNFSPLNFGAGLSTDGNTYLSLIPNPNGDISALGYNVEIIATPGSAVNGECSIVNGAYSGGSNGCTVTVTSGSAYFHIF